MNNHEICDLLLVHTSYDEGKGTLRALGGPTGRSVPRQITSTDDMSLAESSAARPSLNRPTQLRSIVHPGVRSKSICVASVHHDSLIHDPQAPQAPIAMDLSLLLL